jgi:hypothetical protein
MGREERIRAAARGLTGEDVLDVAICHPDGYVDAQVAGTVAGGAAGSLVGHGFATVGSVLGTAAGGRLFAAGAGLPEWIVLAVTPGHVYVMGTSEYHDTDLTPLVRFDRDHLEVRMTSGLTRHLTLTDTEHGVSLPLQAKLVGSLGIKALVELLRLDDRHADPDA